MQLLATQHSPTFALGAQAQLMWEIEKEQAYIYMVPFTILGCFKAIYRQSSAFVTIII